MSLDASDITAAYPGTNDVLVRQSLSVPAGELVGLAGPSGSGKSTMARVLALLLAPREGVVCIDGVDVSGVGFSVPPDVRRKVALLFQSPRSATDPRMTLRSIIEQPAVIARRAADVDELADSVGLTTDLLARKPHQVSDGQLQRACVARALAQKPKYLICDEATAMLDAATTAAIVRLIQGNADAAGMGVLMISHDVELLSAIGADTTFIGS
ncbi:ABC transporter ATP-binding protein [Rhodococcus sp. 06-156-3C]|uniref:ABC transporter ATP-binding protein n=1 Tax=Nocardiaceae TaxID=85025 RepID=UPI000522EEBE|nr:MULTISPECIES: ATP-binding cassette domain-containing protein [Rhodococcus]OZC53725.1 ABC transporter ATP-binding protein [Rhodococcus sp. 06-621-2]OZD12500.1 ABC transporter ATP-binding protein [Rhodococcus sp. 06-156-4a]OZD18091.1 ABC transporter ATP-binding protein [Rhodococcus sp. 06-156-3C]OZD20346.1 ABC transporter ATP-binding protein [Rhodococcus sp. 06-156-4C]OZD29193.1 ABC transporter ATP-binding protein [Rhodococcus sp. 06-156-3]